MKIGKDIGYKIKSEICLSDYMKINEYVGSLLKLNDVYEPSNIALDGISTKITIYQDDVILKSTELINTNLEIVDDFLSLINDLLRKNILIIDYWVFE